MQPLHTTASEPSATAPLSPPSASEDTRLAQVVLERLHRRRALVTVGAPVVGSIVTVFATLYLGFSLLYLAAFAVMYFFTMLGVTLGYHRLAAHRAFTAPAWVESLALALGSMASQGPLFYWVAVHRQHHARTETELDPHSPSATVHGRGIRGWWHAHAGWLFVSLPLKWRRLTRDMLRNRHMVRVNANYRACVMLGIALPGIACGLIGQSWTAAFLGACWGGPLRIMVAQHATWSVNSFAHIFGTRRFNTSDNSRNNALVALLTHGEGWHNNHHASPAASRHGVAWYEIDITYLSIRALKAVGLAWELRERNDDGLRAE